MIRPSTGRAAARALALLVPLALLLSGCAAEPGAKPAPAPAETAETRAPAPVAEDAPIGAPQASEVPPNPGYDQAELDAHLRSAAWSNDVDMAERLIAWGANVNAKDDTVQSAYLIATSEGHLELLRLTLAHGADVNDLDSWVGTGLIRAAERGHWEIVGALIRAGVPLDHVNRVGYQAIHEAVIFGRDDESYHQTVRVLVAGGADVATPSGSEGLTPVQMATWKGYPQQAALLEALTTAPAPADPTAALFAAAEAGDPNAVTIALRAGAPLDARDAAGRTALEVAEAGNHPVSAGILRALGG